MQKIFNVTLSGFIYAIWHFVYIVRLLACVKNVLLSKSPFRPWGPLSFVFSWHQELFLAEEWTLPWTSNQCRG